MNIAGLRSSVNCISIGFDTEKYIIIIFLGTKEFKKTKEDMLCLCSANIVHPSLAPNLNADKLYIREAMQSTQTQCKHNVASSIFLPAMSNACINLLRDK
jgi:hypothetical protein